MIAHHCTRSPHLSCQEGHANHPLANLELQGKALRGLAWPKVLDHAHPCPSSLCITLLPIVITFSAHHDHAAVLPYLHVHGAETEQLTFETRGGWELGKPPYSPFSEKMSEGLIGRIFSRTSASPDALLPIRSRSPAPQAPSLSAHAGYSCDVEC